MGIFNGFRGIVGGSVQSSYTDQPGRGVPGMIAFASEQAVANIDSIFIGGTDGIHAGRGVCYEAQAVAAYNMQTPPVNAILPVAGNTVADFRGILVFDETMQSDASGIPGYNPGRVGRILRKGKSGGRIHVRVMDTIDPSDDIVYMCTVASTDGAYQPGDFTNQNTAAGGTFTSLDTVAKWVIPATGTLTAPALGMIEFI